jgi:hypothetical protein
VTEVIHCIPQGSHAYLAIDPYTPKRRAVIITEPTVRSNKNTRPRCGRPRAGNAGPGPCANPVVSGGPCYLHEEDS